MQYKVGQYIRFSHYHKVEYGKITLVEKRYFGKNAYEYIRWKVLNDERNKFNGLKVEDNEFIKRGTYKIKVVDKDEVMVELL